MQQMNTSANYAMYMILYLAQSAKAASSSKRSEAIAKNITKISMAEQGKASGYRFHACHL